MTRDTPDPQGEDFDLCLDQACTAFATLADGLARMAHQLAQNGWPGTAYAAALATDALDVAVRAQDVVKRLDALATAENGDDGRTK